MTAASAVPALSLVASPSKRLAVIDAAKQAERLGFPAIACPTIGGALGFVTSLAHTTSTIEFFTSIQGIYGVHAGELGALAVYVQEAAEGRFRLGLGVSHTAMTKRFGVESTTPIADMRDYVDALRRNERFGGTLPPLYLAALRDRMLDVAVELGAGAVGQRLTALHAGTGRPGAARISGRVPGGDDPDRDRRRRGGRRRGEPADARRLPPAGELPQLLACRRLSGRDRRRGAGARRRAARNGLAAIMGDAWLADCTLYGPVDRVREGFAAWAELGVQPIAVMSSTSGGQLKAVGELFAAFA